MTNSKTLLDDIKNDLAKVRMKDRPLKTKDIIDGLAGDIYEQLKQGAPLEEVYEIIRGRLPASTKLTLATFKKYWRESREMAGLPPIRNGRQKKIVENSFISKKMNEIVKKAEPQILTQTKTAQQFREDPDNI